MGAELEPSPEFEVVRTTLGPRPNKDPKVLIYVVRRDLRVADNPILRWTAYFKHEFTHLLPVYIFPAKQMVLSGFLKDSATNPFPEPRSDVGKYWRCGPHRAKFIGESVWDLKESLEALGSGVILRAGSIPEVVRGLVDGLGQSKWPVGGIHMTSHEGTEEIDDERAIKKLCDDIGVEFQLWNDEKHFIDDRDVKNAKNISDVFTTYRKECEPLRKKPRNVLPAVSPGYLPRLPDSSVIPAQASPFTIPETLETLLDALVKPVASFLDNIPNFPKNAVSAHPFQGGETRAHARLKHLIESDGLKNYKETRNGLIGTEFSTKLSAYLAQGCITARQIHHALKGYEDGTDETFKDVEGYGAGENEGTAAIRFELLWRDYMRLSHRKFGRRLFYLSGTKGYELANDPNTPKTAWKTAAKEKASKNQEPGPERIGEIIARFNAGTTGMGLIDAAQRELLHTGYTSNRARQNVASFLAKHLEIDWRYGAEWYEMLLVDYDVSSNWGNWQYVAGVGNDPRGASRIFNPVKQAFDYDKDGSYVRAWVPEVATLSNLENVFQVCTASDEDLEAAGLADNVMVTDPVKHIEFFVDSKPPKLNKRPFFRRRGRGRGRGGGESTVSPTSDGAPSYSNSEGYAKEPRSSGSLLQPVHGRNPQVQPPIPHGPRGGFTGPRGIGRGNMAGFPGQQRGGYQGQQRGGYKGLQRGGYQGLQRGGYHHSYAPPGSRGGYSRGQFGAMSRFQGAGRGHWESQLQQYDG